MRRVRMLLAIVALVPGLAAAATVDVVITGTVVFNAIGDPPLSTVGGGDGVTISFSVDSENFDEGVPGDTRGYVIDHSSFSMEFDTPLTQGLLDPFPGGQTPYFVLVEGFPVSDGFFVSTFNTSPGGVPLEQTPFNANFSVGYTGDTLDSLDILDALGIYDFTGLTSFGFNIWAIFPDNVALEIDFEQMTIMEGQGGDGGGDGGSDVPATSTGGLLILAGILLAGTLYYLRRSQTA